MTITLNIKNGTLIEGESQCRTCRNAHIQKGYRDSEEAVFCIAWGPPRAVPFKVADCTDYSNRHLPYRWELEKMALLINVEPKRKPAGFKTGNGLAEDADNEDADYDVSSTE